MPTVAQQLHASAASVDDTSIRGVGNYSRLISLRKRSERRAIQTLFLRVPEFVFMSLSSPTSNGALPRHCSWCCLLLRGDAVSSLFVNRTGDCGLFVCAPLAMAHTRLRQPTRLHCAAAPHHSKGRGAIITTFAASLASRGGESNLRICHHNRKRKVSQCMEQLVDSSVCEAMANFFHTVVHLMLETLVFNTVMKVFA